MATRSEPRQIEPKEDLGGENSVECRYALRHITPQRMFRLMLMLMLTLMHMHMHTHYHVARLSDLSVGWPGMASGNRKYHEATERA